MRLGLHAELRCRPRIHASIQPLPAHAQASVDSDSEGDLQSHAVLPPVTAHVPAAPDLDPLIARKVKRCGHLASGRASAAGKEHQMATCGAVQSRRAHTSLRRAGCRVWRVCPSRADDVAWRFGSWAPGRASADRGALRSSSEAAAPRRLWDGYGWCEGVVTAFKASTGMHW